MFDLNDTGKFSVVIRVVIDRVSPVEIFDIKLNNKIIYAKKLLISFLFRVAFTKNQVVEKIDGLISS